MIGGRDLPVYAILIVLGLLVASGVALGISGRLHLPVVSEGQTVDLTWARVGIQLGALASFVTGFLTGRSAEGRPYRSSALLATMGMVFLVGLIPALGRRAVPVEDAITFGVVTLVFVTIIVSNLRLAWKHREDAADSSGTSA